MKRTLNAMTVDVEDWFNASILQVSGKIYPPSKAVEKYGFQLLELFEFHDVKATWFFLGEVAKDFPELVRAVVDADHEPGVHGYHHHHVPKLSMDAHRESIIRAKDTVEQIAGRQVRGYRAVDFGVNPDTWYVFDNLAAAGFAYDSSIFPFKGPRYGMGDAPLTPHWVSSKNGDKIFEIPVSVAKIMGLRIPFAGGGYFRLFPFAVTRYLFSRVLKTNDNCVFYLHPCELAGDYVMNDIPKELTAAEQHALIALYKSGFKNTQRTKEKLEALISNFSFSSIETVFGDTLNF